MIGRRDRRGPAAARPPLVACLGAAHGRQSGFPSISRSPAILAALDKDKDMGMSAERQARCRARRDAGSRISDGIPSSISGAINTPVFRASTILFSPPWPIWRMPGARPLPTASSMALHGLPTVGPTCKRRSRRSKEGNAAAPRFPSGLTATTHAACWRWRAPGGPRAGHGFGVRTDAPLLSANNHLTRYGVEVSYYDPLAGAAIEAAFRPNTRIVFAESSRIADVSRCRDIPAIAGRRA